MTAGLRGPTPISGVDADLADARILVVDDEPSNVVLLERLLIRNGYRQVRTTTDARTADDEIAGWDPALLLLDWRMPGRSGADILAELREDVETMDLAVIVLTAETGDARLHALELGADDLIVKPFDPLEVLLRIRHVLREDMLRAQLQRHNEHLEQRVRERTAELERANTELIGLDRMRQDFVAMASHELRTPLTVIRGFVEMWRAREELLDSPDRGRHLAAMNRHVLRMQRLVENLLTAAQLDGGAIGLQLDEVDVCAVVRRAVEDASSGEDEITIRCHADPRAEADPHLTTQVLFNLLTNAQNYGAPPIAVETHTTDDAVVVTVTDRGPGVPEAFAPRLFERFSQASTGDRRTAVGAGLGLWISRRLIEVQGGDIWYRGVREGGAEFGISLPRAEPAPVT